MEGEIKKFTINIIGKDYEFHYISPEHEANCRNAAEEVNRIAQQYKTLYFGQEENDILRIIAFQAAKESLRIENKCETGNETMQEIANDLHAYIEKEKNSR